MLFSDRLFLSRVGKYELAAAMSGGLTSLVLSAFFTGIVGYVAALAAQYHGAKRHPMCTRSTTQALYVGLASYPIILCFLPMVRFFFEFAGQDPQLAALATTYARTLLAGTILVVLRTALDSFFVGIGKTRIPMVANIGSACVNIPLSYALIFGKAGLPQMGIQGAALGTIGGNAFSFLVVLGFYVLETSRPPFRASRPMRFVPDIMKRLLRYGLPAGFEPFLNWFAFNIFVQIMHSYGPDTAAAATIAFNWDSVAFIPMVGLGAAATTVVGQHLGAGEQDRAEKSVYLTLRLGLLYAAGMMILFLGFTRPLVGVFSSGLQETSDAIAGMATAMLRLLALYSAANASKLVLGGSLRAAGDTAWVMWVSILIHWAMAVAAIMLARTVGAHQLVTWATLVIMNNAHCATIFYRFRTGRWRRMRLIG
jgi:MATE family multidrug resistance protein